MKIRSNIVKLLVAPFLCCLMFLSVGCGMKQRSRMHEPGEDSTEAKTKEDTPEMIEMKRKLATADSGKSKVKAAEKNLRDAYDKVIQLQGIVANAEADAGDKRALADYLIYKWMAEEVKCNNNNGEPGCLPIYNYNNPISKALKEKALEAEASANNAKNKAMVNKALQDALIDAQDKNVEAARNKLIEFQKCDEHAVADLEKAISAYIAKIKENADLLKEQSKELCSITEEIEYSGIEFLVKGSPSCAKRIFVFSNGIDLAKYEAEKYYEKVVNYAEAVSYVLAEKNKDHVFWKAGDGKSKNIIYGIGPLMAVSDHKTNESICYNENFCNKVTGDVQESMAVMQKVKSDHSSAERIVIQVLSNSNITSDDSDGSSSDEDGNSDD